MTKSEIRISYISGLIIGLLAPAPSSPIPDTANKEPTP